MCPKLLILLIPERLAEPGKSALHILVEFLNLVCQIGEFTSEAAQALRVNVRLIWVAHILVWLFVRPSFLLPGDGLEPFQGWKGVRAKLLNDAGLLFIAEEYAVGFVEAGGI